MSLPNVVEMISGGVFEDLYLGGDGNLTPPVSTYNTSLASSIITISGLPLGVIAIIINAMLVFSKSCVCGLYVSTYTHTYSYILFMTMTA